MLSPFNTIQFYRKSPFTYLIKSSSSVTISQNNFGLKIFPFLSNLKFLSKFPFLSNLKFVSKFPFLSNLKFLSNFFSKTTTEYVVLPRGTDLRTDLENYKNIKIENLDKNRNLCHQSKSSCKKLFFLFLVEKNLRKKSFLFSPKILFSHQNFDL